MKPCPWCGNSEIQILQTDTDPKIFVAACDTCGAKAPPANPSKYAPKRDCIDAAEYLWNERFT